jgi:CRP-like cAMP-binding protein
LNNRQLKQIADLCAQRSFEPDQKIVTQGERGFGMFLLINGRAEAVLEQTDGKETVVNEFGPTDYFGEVNILDGGPRTASVIAREGTGCLFLGWVAFIAMMNKDAKMATDIAVERAKRLRRACAYGLNPPTIVFNFNSCHVTQLHLLCGVCLCSKGSCWNAVYRSARGNKY